MKGTPKVQKKYIPKTVIDIYRRNDCVSQNSNNDYYFNSKNDDAYNGDDYWKTISSQLQFYDFLTYKQRF